MKEITISCHETTTIFENYASNFRKKLMLLLFLFVASTSAFAQLPSCFVTGDAVGEPFPQAVIEACADGSNLNYRATPSVPSTFSWVLSLNTSGATIVGTSTAQSIEVNPGNAEGLFTLTCTVTSIATSAQNFCAVSVAVYKPTVTPVPAARCGPGDITLGASGLGFNSVANWYAASSGGAPIFTGSSYTTTVPSTTSFWVSSTVTTPFLSLICESPRVEVVATVNQPATVNANDDQIICAGSTVTLAGSVGGGASSGTWSTSGNGSFDPSASTLDAVYIPSAADVTAGTLTLTLTTNDPEGPCPAVQDDMIVTINPPAIANAGTDDATCFNNQVNTVQLSGSATGGTPDYTYEWTAGPITFLSDVNIANPMLVNAPVGVHTFTLTVTDANGCMDTDTVDLEVYENPMAEAGDPAAACYDDGVNQIQLSGSATGGTPDYTYEWTAGPITFLSDVNIANPMLVNAPVGVHTFTLTVMDANGCMDTDTVDLEVYENPMAEAGDPAAACYDDGVNQIQLSGSATGGTPDYTYEWTAGPITFLSDVNIANPMLVNAPVGVHTFTLTVTDANGCSDTDTVVLEIYANPICSTSNNGPICAGDNVSLSETGGGAVIWLWSSNGAATFNDATLQNPTASGAVDGEIFSVLITDINGCTSTCTTTVTVQSCAQEGCTLGYWKNHTDRWCQDYRTCDLFGEVFVDAPSNLANLTLLEALNLGGGGIYNLARQGVAALLNTCSDEVDYAGYFDNSSSVIDAVNAAYRTAGTAPGLLASQLDTLNNSGCPLGGTRANKATNCIDSAPTTNTSTEIETIKTELAGFTASPVPFKNQLTIRYDFDYQSDVTIEVFNAQGVLVFSKLDTNSYLNKEVTFDIKVNKGQEQVYIIKLTTNQGSSTRKVMSSR
jgi:hypothetical protein